ncbi:hypothetical protein GGP62_003213 [Salinibacter ruber]|uniref:sulfotransferase n=1 Tax=Salinibacter ruber TaxID=146919 RepID=UPI0021683C46|nr:hypothetical protein [Salinibacter ruber]
MIDQVPLVYIASNGHSGSTLLDLLLGAHEKVWTLGEAQNLPWELRNRRAPCGCGQPVGKDDFWRPLLDDIPLEVEGYHIGYFRNIAQVGKVLRWSVFPDVLRNEIRDEWRLAVQEYGANNYQYFETVREAAAERTGEEIQWLVDNSKDPYRLFWLQHSGYVKVRVIHLVKDPRAFVYSMTKDDPSNLKNVLRYTGRWVIENAIISTVARKSVFDENVRRITYDELAQHPRQTLQSLGDWLGVDYDPSLVDTFREYENHALSGNMMRWRNSEEEIYYDERWREETPAAVQHLITALVQPFAGYCGYPELYESTA